MSFDIFSHLPDAKLASKKTLLWLGVALCAAGFASTAKAAAASYGFCYATTRENNAYVSEAFWSTNPDPKSLQGMFNCFGRGISDRVEIITEQHCVVGRDFDSNLASNADTIRRFQRSGYRVWSGRCVQYFNTENGSQDMTWNVVGPPPPQGVVHVLTAEEKSKACPSGSRMEVWGNLELDPKVGRWQPLLKNEMRVDVIGPAEWHNWVNALCLIRAPDTGAVLIIAATDIRSVK